MNNKLRMVLKKRYEADIEDAKYKIKCYSEHELVIPEHPDITAEVDKLLDKMSQAEEKLAVMELHYGKTVADKAILQTMYMYVKSFKKTMKMKSLACWQS